MSKHKTDRDWLASGVRVGDVQTWRGEQVRELGLEPSTELVSFTMRVTKVTPDTITVSAQ